MDDMDRESVEKFNGKPKFFTGEYSKYGWRKLFDPSLGGREMLELYSEALDRLQTNAKIPELFRNIFKNAFLPYKDPATLKMFLKQIDEFEYSHSEKLGDAFEYLLSVMGSQGDAGQFRTPRHIIDFITACVDPKKNETVADPACGTAGFLLSAYKHILNQNTDKRLGDKLTPDQRRKLSENLVGYDISPDMVRLSLVNMYLHGFATPQIHEYDTLSSEDRWNETFDVILANPPFMTPKGGIRPHKKFGVQANKAEVLFTDYIAEHLNKSGRAGIVVPNGIVATTQTAYKQLRKLLVEESLLAVISLPAGCFNPYSGVKTSILLLDKCLAKKADSILFIKISNDGYDLGAQRREIENNDLPAATDAFNVYKKCLSEGKPFDIEKYNDLCQVVEKGKILSNKDVILSGDRYRTNSTYETVEFDLVKLEEVVEILDSKRRPISKGNRKEGIYPYYGATGIVDYVNDYLFDERLVLLGEDGAKWGLGEKSAFIADGKYWVNNHAHVLKPNREKIIDTYLTEVLNFMDLTPYITGVTVPKLNQENMRGIQIPLPPLETQEEIVREIERYQKIIDGAKMVVDNYRPTIKINPEWEMVELGSVFKLSSGNFLPNKNKVDGNYNVYGGNGINGTHNDYFIEEPTLVIGRVGEYCGAVHITTPKSWATDNCLYVTNYLIKVNQEYLKYALIHANLNQYAKVGGQPSISQGSIYEVKIQLPPLDEQTQIVQRIEQEQALANANKQLITLFEQKIKNKIDEVWGVKKEAK